MSGYAAKKRIDSRFGVHDAVRVATIHPYVRYEVADTNAVGPAPESCTRVAAPSDMSVDHTEPFDFRSSRFCTDALTLARATGKTLQSCRQELFIAESDMGLAYELLASGYEGEPVMHTVH